MRLYLTVAALTFAGSYAVYSGPQMFGAARAIGGDQSGAGAAGFVKSFNPFALLQTDRLRALAGSNAGLPRMEPFRPNIDTSQMLRAMRGPAIDPNIGRNVYISPPPQVRVPQVYTPAMRFHR